jgi:hypothetical protein
MVKDIISHFIFVCSIYPLETLRARHGNRKESKNVIWMTECLYFLYFWIDLVGLLGLVEQNVISFLYPKWHFSTNTSVPGFWLKHKRNLERKNKILCVYIYIKLIHWTDAPFTYLVAYIVSNMTTIYVITLCT